MSAVLDQILQFLWDSFFRDGIMILLLGNLTGYIIKKYIKPVPNDLIPLICGIVGAISAIFLPQMYIEDAIITKGLKGFMLGLAATGLYEMVRRIISIQIAKLKSEVPLDYLDSKDMPNK